MKRRLSDRLLVKATTLAVSAGVLTAAQRLVRRFSSVGRAPFFDPSVYDWTAGLEMRWAVIRDELRALLQDRDRIPAFHEVSREQLRITNDDKWKTFWLYVYGRKLTGNCGSCPETTRLLEAIPGMKTAFFSILAPRKHIPEHEGPYAGVLRCHLGLVVPRDKEACRIRVSNDVAHWEEGRSLVFDDTYPHEVWNDTDEERVVLFLDVLRPLPPLLSALNEAMTRLFSRSWYVQEIFENVAEPKPAETATT